MHTTHLSKLAVLVISHVGGSLLKTVGLLSYEPIASNIEFPSRRPKLSKTKQEALSSYGLGVVIEKW